MGYAVCAVSTCAMSYGGMGDLFARLIFFAFSLAFGFQLPDMAIALYGSLVETLRRRRGRDG